ncbi:MAG TPA: transglutaminase family protein [Polyangia bacterium]|nr:transglutaminase family protein [Polyangia bacterium]
MGINVSLHHKTVYAYDQLVQLTPQVVRLRPAPHCRTPIKSYSLKIAPSGHFLNWQQDPFGNYQARLVFPNEVRRFEVVVDLIAEMTAINPFDFFVEEAASEYPFKYDAALAAELAPYLQLLPGGDRFAAFVRSVQADLAKPGRRTLDVLIDVNRRVQQTLKYDIRMEPGVFAPEETLARGHGSCRDFAWLLVQVLRRLGLAARFVSGYSIQLVADVKALDGGPSGVSQDVTDLHAWAEVYLPGAGWIGFDATSGLACAEGHIPLACTPDPGNAAPITGGYAFTPRYEGDKVKDTFTFEMKVERVREEPRVTKPYTEEAWAAIMKTGRLVDDALVAGDVRLSMGGEPTFVSIDDPDGAEWNTEALGPTKRKLGENLLHRMHGKFAPGGVLHHGQGKWYPGEPLPRWAMTCYFRKDGVPMWRQPSLFAREGGSAVANDASVAFVRALARRLDVGDRTLIPAYEDMFYYLWRERRLPVNVDMLESKLDDAVERARLARVMEQGLSHVVGQVLPLEPVSDWNDATNIHWRTGNWPVRSERFFLIPGDSPMGFRLPLDSLPWQSKEGRRVYHEPDGFAPRRALQIPGQKRPGEGDEEEARARRVLAPVSIDAPGVVRTALCTEVRNGILNVFLPPLPSTEAFVDLVAAIEDTAASLSLPVRIEGYQPLRDPRLGQFAVTPDPGVIEVNIQPAYSWDELVSNTEILYEEARQTRLGTEKFQLDGRHTGTGGGNHVVMGGATPADSPLLRRPDLLRSLIGYFVNHPALSYLFSGMFVGPTSQAPRLDEARSDSIDELEIAFRQIDERGKGAPTPPWLVDRIFRNLLVDVTGNTHRAELCVDKLFNPDSASGRQGLLELRSFEMPPHARMSMAQQLILRGLVASFWQTPYTERPARWGTALQDRFALPHFLWQDLGDVVGDLRKAGFPFETSWFIPHYEFRFPIMGEAASAGIDLQLRAAIEPWHVLGEESGGSGQVRYVDSSLERMQLKVSGYTDDRYAVACNGWRVPLHPTGVSGEYVAGVRFRAWQPPSALHPRIGVHAPLVFDIVDQWNKRSVGGCTYHVSHQGGMAHERRPINALEAEGRRLARFFAFGHTPGGQSAAFPAEAGTARGFPLTLDLRRGT